MSIVGEFPTGIHGVRLLKRKCCEVARDLAYSKYEKQKPPENTGGFFQIHIKFPEPFLPNKGKFLGVDQGPEDVFVREFGSLFVFLDVGQGGGKFLCIRFMTQGPEE